MFCIFVGDRGSKVSIVTCSWNLQKIPRTLMYYYYAFPGNVTCQGTQIQRFLCQKFQGIQEVTVFPKKARGIQEVTVFPKKRPVVSSFA
jgi:hypothetical protein